MGLDLSEFENMVADLGKAGARILPAVDRVVEKAAVNIKKDWAERWTGLKFAPRLGSSVTYDRVNADGMLGAEIGPDKERVAGPLGNIYEFGTVRNAPTPGGQPALDEEAPRFENAIGDVVGDLVISRS